MSSSFIGINSSNNQFAYELSGMAGASGYHGNSGSSGSSDGAHGSDGSRGGDGYNGENAKNLDLQLSVQDGTVFASHKDGIIPFPLGGPHSMYFHAEGGRGGNGGPGGRGGDGHHGYRGQDATRHSHGTDGGPGGDGGNGANGGIAGNGGNGGHITLTLNPEDTDLLMLTNVPNVQRGSGGHGGHGGDGGSGGSGGHGGSSHHWTTTSYHTDSNGETLITTHHHSNPGGSSGFSGSNGSSGYNGAEGFSGKDGSFAIHVGNKRYSGPYNLQVASINLKDSNDDGINEPNEKMRLGITVKNIGHMPTPANQAIRMNLNNTDWVNYDPQSSLVVVPSLNAGESYTLNGDLLFRINDAVLMINKKLNTTGVISYRATVDRVNRDFRTISEQTSNFAIQYPVEITPLIGTKTIAMKEESALSFCVKNISTREIGIDSVQNRSVQLFLNVRKDSPISATDISFTNCKHIQQLGQDGLSLDVKNLKSKEIQHLSGTLQFVNPKIRPYSKVQLAATLHLAHVDEERRKEIKSIQEQHFDVQFVEAYRKNPNADFLLVTNNSTTPDEISAWEKLSDELGLNISVWNSSLYDGVSLFENLDTDSNLVTDFKGKTIVFLNYSFQDGMNKQQNSLKMLPSFELFNAAKEHGIKSYIIGDLNMPNEQLVPSNDQVMKITETVIKSKLFFESSANPEELKEKVTDLANDLRQKDPRQGFIIIKEFAKERLSKKKTLKPEYQLGNVKICSAHQMNATSLLQVTISENEIHTPNFVNSKSNVYALLKMLPFERKLTAIQSISSSYKSVLKQAIISDLVDEQFIFSRDGWSGDLNSGNLKKGLNQLHRFITWDWSQGLSNNHVLNEVADILIFFRAFVKRIPDKSDYLWFYRRKRILSSVTKEIIDDFLIKNLKLKKQDWNNKKEIEDSLIVQDKATLWNQLRNPMQWVNFYQNNWDANPRITEKSEFMKTQANIHGSTVKTGKNHFWKNELRTSALETLELEHGESVSV